MASLVRAAGACLTARPPLPNRSPHRMTLAERAQHAGGGASLTLEPITFVVAVHDREELRHNLRSSPVVQSRQHHWCLVDNPRNERYQNIAQLYQHGLERATTDLVVFIHQDVYLPAGWERRLQRAIAALETRDMRWGVVGSVGVLPALAGHARQLRGHWRDPSGHHYEGPLPAQVQALDEQWLCVRKSRGLAFDADLPGFHCYGVDLALTALDRGLKSYAIDAPAWHKRRDAQGRPIGSRDESAKIRERWSDEFTKQFHRSAEYVGQKWRKYLPFHSTCWSWE